MYKIFTLIILLSAAFVLMAGEADDFDRAFLINIPKNNCVPVESLPAKLKPSKMLKQGCRIESLDRANGLLLINCNGTGYHYAITYGLCMDALKAYNRKLR